MASAASDWGLEVVTYPMSIMIAAGGITAALTGKWTLKVVISTIPPLPITIYLLLCMRHSLAISEDL